MASKHFQAELLATVILVFLAVSDATPAASKLIPDGREKMLAAPSVGIGGRVGWRKMNARRVMMESARGKFPVAGLSVRRSLRPFPPPPPPSPVHNPSPRPKRPPRRGHPPPSSKQ